MIKFFVYFWQLPCWCIVWLWFCDITHEGSSPMTRLEILSKCPWMQQKEFWSESMFALILSYCHSTPQDETYFLAPCRESVHNPTMSCKLFSINIQWFVVNKLNMLKKRSSSSFVCSLSFSPCFSFIGPSPVQCVTLYLGPNNDQREAASPVIHPILERKPETCSLNLGLVTRCFVSTS